MLTPIMIAADCRHHQKPLFVRNIVALHCAGSMHKAIFRGEKLIHFQNWCLGSRNGQAKLLFSA